MFEMQKIKDWSEVLLKWITIIAIPIGAWWTYHNYSITDTAELNPVINVSADVIQYDKNSSLLVVHVKPKNIGKIPITLTGGKNGGDIFLTIKTLPADLKTGIINQHALPTQFDIKSFAEKYSWEYKIEPDVEYDEVRSFIVPKGMTYIISAELDLPFSGSKKENGYKVDSTFVIEVK